MRSQALTSFSRNWSHEQEGMMWSARRKHRPLISAGTGVFWTSRSGRQTGHSAPPPPGVRPAGVGDTLLGLAIVVLGVLALVKLFAR